MLLPVCGGGSNSASTSDEVTAMFEGGGSFKCTTLLEGNSFIGFNSTQKECGGVQTAVGVNMHAPDYVPIANFLNTNFIDSDEDAMFYFSSPLSEWANPDQCGDFTCSGLYNVIAKFE